MAEGLIAPIGNMEILRNVHKIPARAENFLGKREKPRASGLMSRVIRAGVILEV